MFRVGGLMLYRRTCIRIGKYSQDPLLHLFDIGGRVFHGGSGEFFGALGLLFLQLGGDEHAGGPCELEFAL